MRLHILAACAGAALLSACGGDANHGETYAVAAADLRATLLDTDAPLQVLGSQAVDWKTASQGDDTVVWKVLGAGDDELIRFAAKLVPVDGGTRVDVEVLAPETKNKEQVTKRLAENDSVRALYHVAMTEEIDAKLENRGFDFTRISGALARATAANMGTIRKSLDEVGEADRKRSRENVDRAYKRERENVKFGSYGEYSGQGKPFGAPMDSPSQN